MSNHETNVENKLDDIRLVLCEIRDLLKDLTQAEQMAEPIDAAQE